VLIRAAAIATGAVGVLLPGGDRVAAGLPLVVGAGAGLVTLAVGSQLVESDDGYHAVFLVGSALGFAATMATLRLLWRRTRRPLEPSPPR
jgi:hypothetical protein